MKTTGNTTWPLIDSLRSESDAAAFKQINEEWITRMFSMTDEDRKLLEDPVARIIAPGGDVLLARSDDSTVVGCIALLPYGNRVFELAKMGVTPHARGQGIGRRLVAAAIDRARELSAERIFLGTNSQLGPAIHLYEEAGFRRISREDLPVADYYARADILMELGLTSLSPGGSRGT
ncbi:MAG: GNAT family N-acetyltransferase [Rhodanobacteraceae bacterium]